MVVVGQVTACAIQGRWHEHRLQKMSVQLDHVLHLLVCLSLGHALQRNFWVGQVLEHLNSKGAVVAKPHNPFHVRHGEPIW